MSSHSSAAPPGRPSQDASEDWARFGRDPGENLVRSERDGLFGVVRTPPERQKSPPALTSVGSNAWAVCRVSRRGRHPAAAPGVAWRSEEHTSELQSLMRISYAVFCLKKKTKKSRS